jgi:hypothetical protein
VHREEHSDLVHLAMPGQERRSQHASHLRREIVLVPGLDGVDLLVQETAQLGIVVQQAMRKPAGSCGSNPTSARTSGESAPRLLRSRESRS